MPKKLFTASIITASISFFAESEEQAEALYSAWFDSKACPVHNSDNWECNCHAGDDGEVDHTWTSAECLHEAPTVETRGEDGCIDVACTLCDKHLFTKI